MDFYPLFLILVSSSGTQGLRGGVIPTEPTKTAVAIFVDDEPQCSGTILSDTWIATAGHCHCQKCGLMTMNRTKVVAGEPDLKSYLLGHSTRAITASIKQIKLHPGYFNHPRKPMDHNIALIELNSSLEISSNPNLEAASLPPPGMEPVGRFVTVEGWGRTNPSVESDKHFRLINITVQEDEHCLEASPNHPDRMICVGNDQQNICGDAGSGALYHGSDGLFILGLAPFGDRNCKAANGFAKLDYYLPWIMKETQLTNESNQMKSPCGGCDYWTRQADLIKENGEAISKLKAENGDLNSKLASYYGQLKDMEREIQSLRSEVKG